MFDQHLPQRRSAFAPKIKVSGDVLIRKNFYPRVDENFIGGHKKLASLLGEGESVSYYRAPNARKVVFEPQLHADYVVYSVGRKVHGVGDPHPLYLPRWQCGNRSL